MIVILANGTYPTGAEPLKLLANADKVVCCDGAALEYIARGGEPDVIIGDLDSFPPELCEKYPDRVHRIAEQETNDLCKAFRYCLDQGWNDVVILGATGKREDHTLGNISLLADFAEQMPSIRMVTDEGEFFAILEKGTFHTEKGQEISLFAFRHNTHIYSEGLMYPLNGMYPEKLWRATLNVATGDVVSISVLEKKPVIVFKCCSVPHDGR